MADMDLVHGRQTGHTKVPGEIREHPKGIYVDSECLQLAAPRPPGLE